MVEAAVEFADICRALDYHNFVFSMKAANPVVMIQGYRLLAAEMYRLGWDYPLHLGVTEAGEGEDGRMKAAIGIGALLADGAVAPAERAEWRAQCAAWKEQHPFRYNRAPSGQAPRADQVNAIEVVYGRQPPN